MSVENSLELNVILKEVERYCAFSLGKERVQHTVPSFDKLVIRRDNQEIKEALECCVKYDTLPFHGITDIASILDHALKDRVLSIQDCLDELRFIAGIRDMVNYAHTLTEVPHPGLNELFGSLTVHTKTERVLSNCFNEYGEVMDSASDKLRSIRISIRRTDSEISSAVQKFVTSHSSSVVDSIVTYRSGRAVVLVKASDKNSFGGMVYGESSSGQTSYVEPSPFVPLNNRRQQLVQEEQEEINRILKMCSKEIALVAEEEKANLETASILDAIFAKAQWGKDREACVASLAEDRSFLIVKGRHPLIDSAKVVSNTYRLTKEKRMLLITGPNTGGKTVSMKVIGLFVLMTYCGMPVTAEAAEIPFFDHVFADIGDDQSVVSSLSSFSAHMTKQAEVISGATSHSLVLLDEIGSGTDPQEGEALAIAILNELRTRGTMGVITTHYDRLKAYGKRHDDILVASVQFDMERLAPTYKYIEGLTGQSNAFEVAERYGLPSSIVKYARYLKNQAKTQEDELIERLEQQLNEAEIQKEELAEKLQAVESEKAKLEKEKDQFAKEKENFRAKAQEEANRYVESVRKEAKIVLKNIRKRQDDVKYHEALDAVKQLNALEQIEEEAENDNMEFTYRVGDAVELKGNPQVCEVVKLGKKDMTIRMNGREMRVKKNMVHPSIHVIPKKKKENRILINTGRDIFATMPQEVNLIGLHVDEALDKMDSYMDQAMLNDLKSFRIIHGDGTGRLRKAVHERLKKNPNVKEFRLGMPQEGGTGATIVVMK